MFWGLFFSFFRQTDRCSAKLLMPRSACAIAQADQSLSNLSETGRAMLIFQKSNCADTVASQLRKNHSSLIINCLSERTSVILSKLVLDACIRGGEQTWFVLSCALLITLYFSPLNSVIGEGTFQ